MNNFIKICITMMILCVAVSCNRDEVFEKEQYKNVFALVSGSDNISAWVHDLRKTESDGYVAASLGGTNKSTKDITVRLVEDSRLIDEYNMTAFDVNTDKYNKYLAASKYSVSDYSMTIRAGEVKSAIPVRVKPEGLSPDSSYMIAFKVDTYSSYEVNPDKDYVLYQVRTRNWWASHGGSSYTMRGTKGQVGSTANPLNVFGTKRVFPLSGTSVRILAGNMLNDNNDVWIYNRYSIVVTIGDDDRVSITPYKTLDVEQIDGDEVFSIIAFLEDDGFKTYKTMLLSYTYRDSNGIIYHVKEELRLEFREDPNDPRFLTQ